MRQLGLTTEKGRSPALAAPVLPTLEVLGFCEEPSSARLSSEAQDEGGEAGVSLHPVHRQSLEKKINTSRDNKKSKLRRRASNSEQ